MMRTIFFFLWMWIVLLFSILLLIPLGILELFKWDTKKKTYIQKVTSSWAGHLIYSSGSKITVTGSEHIPADQSFCLLSNHQSNFDIPILLSIMPVNLGFIGKYEMLKVPFLNTWMKSLNCVFIKRGNIMHSIRGLQEAMKNVKNGQSMALFPEGTRSRDGVPGKFHRAGINIAIGENILILPVSIINSNEMFEKTNRITPVNVEVVIHQPCQYRPDETESGSLELIETLIQPINKGIKK